MSMNPGATTLPVASIRSPASTSARPPAVVTAAIRFPRIPTSPTNAAAPVPSTTSPFSMTMSIASPAPESPQAPAVTPVPSATQTASLPTFTALPWPPHTSRTPHPP